LENEIYSVVSRVSAGDEAAFGKLCEMYAPLIRSMSRKYADMVDGADVAQLSEDFSQEAVLALYRAACTYKPGGGEVSFGLYSKICIRNALVSELRRMKRKRIHRSDREEYTDAGIAGENITSRIDRSVLSRFELSVLDLYVGGAKVREIASILGKSSKSVSNAVYRIKAKIRESLGGTHDIGSKPQG